MVCFLVRLLACVAAVVFPFPGGEIEQAGERRNASRVRKKEVRRAFVCNSVPCACVLERMPCILFVCLSYTQTWIFETSFVRDDLLRIMSMDLFIPMTV